MTGKPDDARLSARELILTLMDSTSADTLGAGYLVAAGELFDMDAGSIRVALARLVRDGSLIAVERGRYGLGSRAGTLHTLVRNWSRAESSLKAWSGGWLTVLTAHLARVNRTQVRANERALGLLGFAAAKPGFQVRPDNLARPLASVREDLLALGLDPDAICAVATALEPADCIDPDTLWDTTSLSRCYRDHRDRLTSSTERLKSLTEAEAARETLLVGRQVTRDILLDPLLPDALVDGRARREMIDAMRAYDRIGKARWRSFYQRHEDRTATADQKPAA